MATYNFDSTTLNTREGQRSLLQKSFLYMFLFLLLTAAVSLIAHYIFGNNVSRDTYIIVALSTAGIQLFLTIIMAFTALKSGKGQLVCFILYAACMGVLISSFTFVLNWWTIMSAFGISALAFGGMALIGAYSKRASAMGIIGMGLLTGVLMVSLFNIFMFLFLPRGVWLIQNIVVSSIIVVAMLLVAAYDVYNIKQISATGENSNNLALHFAFSLYLDFILIFIHLIRILAIVNRR